MPVDYDDDYPTCLKTYAGLRIYHDDLDPERISSLMGIAPCQTQVRGQVQTTSIGKEFIPPIGGWFLSTEGITASRDVRRHVAWILDRLAGKDEILRSLQTEGCRIDMFCYWLSADGHGGPIVSPAIMRRLGELELEVGFDIYGPYDE
jgi:Domain of unknown function (DUF4279)